MFANLDLASVDPILLILGGAIAAIVLLLVVRAFSGNGSTADNAPALQPNPTPAATFAAPAEDGISDEVVAAITAAIAAMTGSSNFTVKSIRRARHTRSPWTMAGLEQNTQSF